MPLRLPLATSPVRPLVDMSVLASLSDVANVRKLPTFRAALHSSREFLGSEQGAKSVNTLTLRADGSLWLVRVTPNAWKRLWNFGKVAA